MTLDLKNYLWNMNSDLNIMSTSQLIQIQVIEIRILPFPLEVNFSFRFLPME